MSLTCFTETANVETYTIHWVGAKRFGEDAEPPKNAVAVGSKMNGSARLLGKLRPLKELNLYENHFPFLKITCAAHGHFMPLLAQAQGGSQPSNA